MKWSDGVITSGSSTTTNRMYYAGLPANGFGAGWQLIDERDGAGAIVRKYVYGPGIDEPVRMTTSNGTKYYFQQDGLGNVTELASSIGAVIERYTYDVYGKPTMYNAGGAVIPSSAIGNRLLFTGRDRDPDTGLYNFRYRYYSPSLGRFVQPDPIRLRGGNLNLYEYVRNNPVNSNDPTGRSALIPAVIFLTVFFLVLWRVNTKAKKISKKIDLFDGDPAKTKGALLEVPMLITEEAAKMALTGGGAGAVLSGLGETAGEMALGAEEMILGDMVADAAVGAVTGSGDTPTVADTAAGPVADSGDTDCP